MRFKTVKIVRVFLVLLAAVMTILLLSGCGSSGSSQQSSGSNQQSSGSSQQSSGSSQQSSGSSQQSSGSSQQSSGSSQQTLVGTWVIDNYDDVVYLKPATENRDEHYDVHDGFEELGTFPIKITFYSDNTFISQSAALTALEKPFDANQRTIEDRGTYSLVYDGTKLRLECDGDTGEHEFTLSGNKLTISGNCPVTDPMDFIYKRQ